MGDDYLKSTTRASLRVLGTVGEPIDPTTWHWYFDKIGQQQAYVADTWWQTETGGHMITPMARYTTPNKPGSVALPFFGVNPVDNNLLEFNLYDLGSLEGFIEILTGMCFETSFAISLLKYFQIPH